MAGVSGAVIREPLLPFLVSIRPVCGLSLVLAAPLPVGPAATLTVAVACGRRLPADALQPGYGSSGCGFKGREVSGSRFVLCGQVRACLPWFWSWLRPGHTEAPAQWPGMVWWSSEILQGGVQRLPADSQLLG